MRWKVLDLKNIILFYDFFCGLFDCISQFIRNVPELIRIYIHIVSARWGPENICNVIAILSWFHFRWKELLSCYALAGFFPRCQKVRISEIREYSQAASIITYCKFRLLASNILNSEAISYKGLRYLNQPGFHDSCHELLLFHWIIIWIFPSEIW